MYGSYVSLNSNVRTTDGITFKLGDSAYFGASDVFFCSTPTWSISVTQTPVRMQLIWCCMLRVWKHSTTWRSLPLKRNTTKFKEIVCRFRTNFLKEGKNCYIPYLFGCLVPCQDDSCPKTQPISTVSRIKQREVLLRCHFFHTPCFLHCS